MLSNMQRVLHYSQEVQSIIKRKTAQLHARALALLIFMMRQLVQLMMLALKRQQISQRKQKGLVRHMTSDALNIQSIFCQSLVQTFNQDPGQLTQVQQPEKTKLQHRLQKRKDMYIRIAAHPVAAIDNVLSFSFQLSLALGFSFNSSMFRLKQIIVEQNTESNTPTIKNNNIDRKTCLLSINFLRKAAIKLAKMNNLALFKQVAAIITIPQKRLIVPKIIIPQPCPLQFYITFLTIQGMEGSIESESQINPLMFTAVISHIAEIIKATQLP